MKKSQRPPAVAGQQKTGAGPSGNLFKVPQDFLLNPIETQLPGQQPAGLKTPTADNDPAKKAVPTPKQNKTQTSERPPAPKQDSKKEKKEKAKSIRSQGPKKKAKASQIKAKDAADKATTKTEANEKPPPAGNAAKDKPIAAGKDAKSAEQNEGEAQKSEVSDDSSSEASEDIVVYETPENQTYERKVIIGHLSRVGFREQFWHNKIQSYFVILSFLLTIDNVTYFFLFTRLFGLWWMVPYAICMLFVGFPLAYLEMALGQYTSTGIFLVFDRMTPAFVGVGVSALLFNFILSCTDHMLFADMAAVATFAMYILSNEMPWSNCLAQDPTKACHVWMRECNLIKPDSHIPKVPPPGLIDNGGREFTFTMQGDSCIRPPSRSIYNGLNDRGGQSKLTTVSVLSWVNAEIHDFVTYEQLTYPSILYLFYSFLSVLLCIFIITRHRRVTVVLLTITLLLTFCVISLLLHGILVLFVPRYPSAIPVVMPFKTGVFGIPQWFAALCLTFRCLKIGQGAWTFFGSQNGFHNNLILDCLVITLVVLFVTYFYSLFHIIAIGSYTQEIMRFDKDVEAEIAINEKAEIFAFHNPVSLTTRLVSATIIFEGYDTVVVLFYSLLVAMVCLANKIVRLEIIVSAFTETMATFSDMNARFVLVIIVCCLGMIIQLGLAFRSGYMGLARWNIVVYPFIGAAITFFELLVLGFFYGFRHFFSNTSVMVYGVAKSESKKMKMFFNTVALADWSVLLPICALFMLICAVYYDHYTETHALDFFSWTWICAILLPIPGYMLYEIYYQYSLGNSIYPLFKRNPDLWGPRSRANRIEAERAERMVRQWW